MFDKTPAYADGDLMARMLAEKLTAILKQTVIVDNRPGAGGNIGAEHAARSPADGYTVLIAASGLVTANAFLYKLNFDPQKDLAPVTPLYSGAPVLVVSPNVKARSLQELIETARREANQRLGMTLKPPTQADIGYRSANALVGSGADIVIPQDSKGPIHFEGELVAVVGKKAKHLTEADALSCIAGYTLGNDLSERTFQKSDRTLWRAKNIDTFKSMGPVVVSGIDPMAQTIAVRVNGRTATEYSTKAMIFSLQHYIARMTRYVTLYPGDVIWMGCDGPTLPALEHGDLVELVNDAIGVLANRVVRET